MSQWPAIEGIRATTIATAQGVTKVVALREHVTNGLAIPH